MEWRGIVSTFHFFHFLHRVWSSSIKLKQEIKESIQYLFCQKKCRMLVSSCLYELLTWLQVPSLCSLWERCPTSFPSNFPRVFSLGYVYSWWLRSGITNFTTALGIWLYICNIPMRVHDIRDTYKKSNGPCSEECTVQIREHHEGDNRRWWLGWSG